MAAGFRGNIFDPALIVAQIVAMQSCFYISLGLWVFVADRFGGIETSLAQIFDFHALSRLFSICKCCGKGNCEKAAVSSRGDQEFEGVYDGWLVMGAVVLNSFTCALGMWWIVRRAKQCLDFAVTVFVVHLVVCLCYAGFPHSWAWWLTNLVSVAIMAVLGEYLCMRSELAAIPVSGSASLGSKA